MVMHAFAVTVPRLWRTAVLMFALGCLLGCAVGTAPSATASSATPAAAAAAATAAATGPALLTPWLTITGGWRAPTSAAPLGAPTTGARINLIQPVGVAARGDVLLIADAGARTLWRLDRTRDALIALAPFTGSAAEQGASLQLGADFSAWVVLPLERQVIQYDTRGRIVRSWRDDAELERPVAVAVTEDRSEVLIGDATRALVLAFDALGRARRVLGGSRAAGPASPLQSITAMSLGPAGLYVLDRIAQQVVVLGPRGELVGLIGENQLVQPRALAVDPSGRVFVSDDADQRIHVFRGRQRLASFGGSGAGPGRFGRIEAMAIDANLLYVADSQNARVQVLLIAPPSMEPRPALP
jgi:hypothetical protein